MIKGGIVGIGVGADKYEHAMQAFLAAHKDAYGLQHLRPKHHWALDLTAQIRRDQCILDAFIIERQHLMVKALAEPVRNTLCFETSVLSSLVVVQLRGGRGQQLGDGLLGQGRHLPTLPSATVTSKLSVHGFTVSVGEVVCRGSDAAVVAACASEGDELFCLVAPMAKVAVETPTSARFRRGGRLDAWRAAELKQCLAWRDEPGGLVLVLFR